jgi:hypothetical protein
MSVHHEPDTQESQITEVRIYWDGKGPEGAFYKYKALSYGELKDSGIMDQTVLSDAIAYAIWWLDLKDVRASDFAVDKANGGSADWTLPPQVVGHTPNGREIRYLHDGTYEVQPFSDNWWARGRTVDEALQKAGWAKPKELIELQLRLEAIDQAIDKFTDACELFSISEIRDGNVPDPTVPSVWHDAAKALSKCRNLIYDELGRKESGL